MTAAARIGDPIGCGDTVAAGSGNVFINGIPASRVGDSTAGHPCGPPTVLAAGSTTVFVNGIASAWVGSSIVSHGTCGGPPHANVVTVGSPTVIIGA